MQPFFSFTLPAWSQSSRSTQSSTLVNLLQPSVDSSLLKITDRHSLLEQASFYSSCSLSVRSFIITELLWSWTTRWPFLPLSSYNFPCIPSSGWSSAIM